MDFMSKPRILITSGPTREYLDPVRYLSNGSSGRMGAALALAVLKRGGSPVLVSGPVMLDYPEEAEIHQVETTDQMLGKCRELFGDCSGAIGAAAPCDYKPEHFSEQKLKKSKREDGLLLKLVETVDILASLGNVKRPDQWIVGFALETENGRDHALEKLNRKNCDFIVLNSPASIASESARLQVFDADGNLRLALDGSKESIAEKLIDLALKFNDLRAGDRVSTE